MSITRLSIAALVVALAVSASAGQAGVTHDPTIRPEAVVTDLDDWAGARKAVLLNGRAYLFQTRRLEGRTAYVLAASAQMPDSCHVLRLLPADDEATTDVFEVLALQVSTVRPDVLCLPAVYDDVASLDFLRRPADRAILLIGANRRLAVPLP